MSVKQLKSRARTHTHTHIRNTTRITQNFADQVTPLNSHYPQPPYLTLQLHLKKADCSFRCNYTRALQLVSLLSSDPLMRA
jgi:hypothetical protein